MNLTPELERWMRRGSTTHTERARAVYLAMRPQIEAELAEQFLRIQKQIAAVAQVTALRELKRRIREERVRSY